jgi:hypothetical protein
MKYQKLLITLAFAVALGAEARAVGPLVSYLAQTNSFSVNPTATLNWNQFDPNLGTLTGITFEASSGLVGSFTVINSSSSSMKARNSTAELLFNFLGTGSPGEVFSDALAPISTSPISNSTGTNISGNSSELFTIGPGQTVDLTLVNWFSYRSYFTGTGAVASSASLAVNVSSTGGLYTVDSSATTANGSAILTYIYQVPEPSAASLLIFGLGGLVAIRCVRRKS